MQPTALLNAVQRVVSVEYDGVCVCVCVCVCVLHMTLCGLLTYPFFDSSSLKCPGLSSEEDAFAPSATHDGRHRARRQGEPADVAATATKIVYGNNGKYEDWLRRGGQQRSQESEESETDDDDEAAWIFAKRMKALRAKTNRRARGGSKRRAKQSYDPFDLTTPHVTRTERSRSELQKKRRKKSSSSLVGGEKKSTSERSSAVKASIAKLHAANKKKRLEKKKKKKKTKVQILLEKDCTQISDYDSGVSGVRFSERFDRFEGASRRRVSVVRASRSSRLTCTSLTHAYSSLFCSLSLSLSLARVSSCLTDPCHGLTEKAIAIRLSETIGDDETLWVRAIDVPDDRKEQTKFGQWVSIVS